MWYGGCLSGVWGWGGNFVVGTLKRVPISGFYGIIKLCIVYPNI